MIKNRMQALKKAREIQRRYINIYKRFIYPIQVYHKLCAKYDLY